MSNPLITIWKFRDLPEALLAKSKLESAEIECFLTNENTVAMDWLYSNLTGGIGLQVASQDSEAALALLQEPVPEIISAATMCSNMDYQQPACPACKSLDIEHRGLNRFVTFGSWLVLGIPIRVTTNKWHCDACGHQWEAVEDKMTDRPAVASEAMTRLYVATSNKGKIYDFSVSAHECDIDISALPGFHQLPEVKEEGATFEENARLKAEAYSAGLANELVIADDSGLEVAALDGAPGVHSARYAATTSHPRPSDSENNYKLLYELSQLPGCDRTARFVCVIAIAQEGKTLATFKGQVDGEILQMPIGKHGFGYDPLFFVPAANKTFAEMDGEDKSAYSHRGHAFRACVEWMKG